MEVINKNCSHLQSLDSVGGENVTNEFSSQSNSSRSTFNVKDDYRGAMKFTVAVVLVYGIGVILLLGFYTKRSRNQVFQEKEGHRFLKDMTANKPTLEKNYDKKKIVDLIRNIHSVPVEDIHQVIPLSNSFHKPSVPCSLQEHIVGLHSHGIYSQVKNLQSHLVLKEGAETTNQGKQLVESHTVKLLQSNC